jgi:hypothetical protein
MNVPAKDNHIIYINIDRRILGVFSRSNTSQTTAPDSFHQDIWRTQIMPNNPANNVRTEKSECKDSEHCQGSTKFLAPSSKLLHAEQQSSSWFTIFFVVVMERFFSQVNCVFKSEFIRNPIVGWLLRRGHGVVASQVPSQLFRGVSAG